MRTGERARRVARGIAYAGSGARDTARRSRVATVTVRNVAQMNVAQQQVATARFFSLPQSFLHNAACYGKSRLVLLKRADIGKEESVGRHGQGQTLLGQVGLHRRHGVDI
jgi:hypothetical protein